MQKHIHIHINCWSIPILEICAMSCQFNMRQLAINLLNLHTHNAYGLLYVHSVLNGYCIASIQFTFRFIYLNFLKWVFYNSLGSDWKWSLPPFLIVNPEPHCNYRFDWLACNPMDNPISIDLCIVMYWANKCIF